MSLRTHVCRTAQCWDEHASNPDGSSRCLWGSRDGVTPSRRRYRGRYFCDQPHALHDGPHTFRLRLRLRFLPARAVPPVAAGLAGAGAVWLTRWVTG